LYADPDIDPTRPRGLQAPLTPAERENPAL